MDRGRAFTWAGSRSDTAWLGPFGVATQIIGNSQLKVSDLSFEVKARQRHVERESSMSQRRRKYMPGSVISGTNYKVLRHIGSGAMGAVYEALHCELKKVFVIKVLHHDLVQHDDPVRRLRTEWQLLAKLDHPNIVSVTDAGFTNDGIPYFVMQRLEGETLYASMRRNPRWSVLSCVQLALDLLEGLVEAHSKGIVHRDIKPSNIFLSQKFGAKLLDFGIAKLLSSSAAITAKGVTLGTPRYMAPEQACGRTADCRSDLYALGVILFELVAGEHPFAQAQTPVEMLIAQAGWEPPALFIGDSSHNDEFVALINSLLSKDPKDRPPTAVAARDYVRGLLSKLELSGSGVEYSPLRTNESVNMTTPVAEETRKLPVARVARSSQHRRKIGIGQEALIPGHRETNVRRRSWRPAIATTLVAIAILSASSLTKPYPIPGILSNVWFSVLHSSAKLNSSKTLLARSAAKHNTSNNGQAAPPQAVLEE